MKKLLTLLFVLVVLVGCGSKTKTTICTAELEGVEIENTIVSTEDYVDSIVYKTTISVDDMLVPYLATAAEDYAKNFVGLSGVSYEYTVEGNVLVELTKIDYKTVNYEDLVRLGLLELEEGVVPTPFVVEYKDLKAEMEASGCTCKIK